MDDIENEETVNKLERTYWSIRSFKNYVTWSLTPITHLVGQTKILPTTFLFQNFCIIAKSENSPQPTNPKYFVLRGIYKKYQNILQNI